MITTTMMMKMTMFDIFEKCVFVGVYVTFTIAPIDFLLVLFVTRRNLIHYLELNYFAGQSWLLFFDVIRC